MVSAADIVIHPNEVLKRKCDPVGGIDAEIRELGRILVAVMLEAPGIGLAAPQIGVSKRVVAIGRPVGLMLAPFVMVDPKIVWRSGNRTALAEGCLSIPDRRFLVRRPDSVKVAFTDLDGRKRLVEATGLSAKCVQHEIDHLDGVLICDIGKEVFPEPLLPQPV